MKRVHIHLFVDDVAASTGFYNGLFTSTPSLEKDDYVRWELTDPPLNFAISNHGKAGIDHLGIQSEDSAELEKMIAQYNNTETENDKLDNPDETSCCYARSTKSWLSDPQGTQWELFTTHHNESAFYGESSSSSCCSASSCC